MHGEIEKYSRATRVLHWVHSGAFIILFLSGMVLFFPALRLLAQDSLSRLIHRIGAAVFIIAPLIYVIIAPKSAGRGLKQLFTWGRDDIGWLRAAPRYYFTGNAGRMPPQGALNTGQKMWWFINVVFGIIFVFTGGIMWFAQTTTPTAFLRWVNQAHDISFVLTGVIFFLHLYMGIFHPATAESWKAITSGKVSAEYAMSHHGKWYEEISRSREKPAE